MTEQRGESDDMVTILRSAINAIPEGFVIFDPDDRLVACNQAYRQLYTASAPAMVPGARFEDILQYGLDRGQYPEAGETRESRERWLAERLRAHRMADTRLVQQVGPSAWVQIEERRLPTGHIVGIRSDVSDMRQLQARNEWHGDIIERSGHEFFIADPQTGRFVYANRGARENLGYDLEQITALHPWDINDAFDRCGIEALFAPLMNGQTKTRSIETVHRRRDGSTYPCRITFHLDREDDRDIIVSVAEDISVQRELENKVLQQRRDLESLLRHIPDAISRALPDTTLTYVNCPYAALLGIDPEALIGQRLTDFILPEHREDFLAAVTALTPDNPIHDTIENIVDSGERERTFHWSNLMIFEGETPVELLSIGRDVTDITRMNDALGRTNEELQNFAYAASHDLRSPIQTMRSLLDMLEQDHGDALPGDAREIVDRLSGVVGRMIQLSNGVLDYARVSGAPTEPELFDGGEMLSGIVANLEAEIRQADARIEVGPIPILYGIRSQIGQVFQNLIGNALKFRAEGRTPEIRIVAQRAKGFHEVTVCDNGIGLSQEDAQLVFAPFHRLHGRHNFPGSGLGLTICRKIVAAHGGEIRIAHPDGPGTCFIVILPEAPDA